MIFEVAFPELCLSFGNGNDGRLERLRCHDAGREKMVQFSLLFDELVTQRDRLLLHGIEKALNLDALIPGQVKAITELENVARAGISVEFGGKREAHTAPGLEIVDLLVRQCLDGALLEARIGLAGLRDGSVGRDDKCGREQKKVSHESGSMKSVRFVDRYPPVLPKQISCWTVRPMATRLP
ncbi:hypothetical protein IVA80_18065 [Bradyrhizobium sp. 139]|uniref:hypothetical protein n=1 Tax=Bradyrhizobium sp. 139 TaxID=2782616 RepID=UPI001FF8A904|nr:hypothetical protein [Bradyrhizobium sp. 139]MCK1742725.1 hypothetical protein [Bradyrhizobium sp. 139]